MSEIIAKYKKRGKYLLILHEATCDKSFTVNCLFESNIARVILLTYVILTYYKLIEAKSARTNLTTICFLTFHRFSFPYFNSNISYSAHLFCIRWSFLIDLFSNFFPENSITFENTYLRSCWFHCVDMFYFKFTILLLINSMTRILLLKTLYKFGTIKMIYPAPTYVWFRLVWIQMFCISHLAFLRFTFHWYLHCSN